MISVRAPEASPPRDALAQRGTVAANDNEPGAGSSTRVPLAWDHAFIYTLSFAGLMAVLFAAHGLLALVTGLLLQEVTTLGTLISNEDARTQAASYLAALIVGIPIWSGFWRLAQRRV